MPTLTPAIIYRAWVHWFIQHNWCSLDGHLSHDVSPSKSFEELMADLRWLIETERFRPGDIPAMLPPDDPSIMEMAYKLDRKFKDGSGDGYAERSPGEKKAGE